MLSRERCLGKVTIKVLVMANLSYVLVYHVQRVSMTGSNFLMYYSKTTVENGTPWRVSVVSINRHL